MERKILLSLFALFCVFSITSGEIIDVNECKKESDKTTLSTIREVDVTPCPGGPPCQIPVGTNATIIIKFTPTRKITKRARHGYFWEQSATLDLPFTGVNPKACKGPLKCPGRKNVEQTYKAVLPIRNGLPRGTYDTKVKLYEGAKVYICKVFKVKLV